MRIVRAADQRRMPWKNGGGVTTEVAIGPPDAALDAFDWRVSMAHVATDGPFSPFPGIDRTLAVLDGDGLELTIAGAAPVVLGPASAPRSFPGDVPVHGRLLGQPINDLNVMTRRGVWRHEVTVHSLETPLAVAPGAGLVVAVIAHDEVLATVAGRVVALARRDAVVIEPTETVELVRRQAPTAPGDAVYLIRLEPIPAWEDARMPVPPKVNADPVAPEPAKKAPAPAVSPKDAAEALREETETETEKRPYLDTEGGE